jgi:hypothetical protein
MRNAMHDQLRNRYGRDDWWKHPQVSLTTTMRTQVQTASKEARRVAARRGRAEIPADTMAQLPLGFWTGLLGPGGRYLYETRFWQPFLHQAFPNYKEPRLKPLQRAVYSFRLFRNRLAHHEPVAHRDLHADHDSILRVAGYLSCDVAGYIDSHSRVPETLSRKDRCMKGYATSF